MSVIELTPAMTENESRAAQNSNNGYLGDQVITDRIASQAEAEAGTDNTKIMPPLRVKQAATKFINDGSAVLIPSPSGDSATLSLTVPAESNPNRLTIMITASANVSSAIRLRVGAGTYYNIVMPTGTGTNNVLSLSAYVPYDLILANISGNLRYVCLNYFEALSRAERLAALGIYKTIWSGSDWSSGSKTIAELPNYNAFIIRLSGNHTIWATRQANSTIRGIGGGYSEANTQYTYTVNLTASGATLTISSISGGTHGTTSPYHSFSSASIVEIIGLF